MRHHLNLASQVPESREALEATLVQFVRSILHSLSDPDVLAVYRPAIAKSTRTPDVARILDKAGREANHLALGAWLAKGQAPGLVGARNPAAMATHFLATLGGGLLIQLLLRVRCADCRRNQVAGTHRERIADLGLPPHRPGD
jgi:hypothetical protein